MTTHTPGRETAAERDRLRATNAELLAALEQFHMAMVLGNVSFRTPEIEVAALDLTRAAIAKAKGEQMISAGWFAGDFIAKAKGQQS